MRGPKYDPKRNQTKNLKMSVDEDTELRDLIIDSLEKKGVLAKIKAELRASVFLALEETENEKYKIPLSNASIQMFKQSKEGCMSLALVRDFLEFFHLDYTLAVLDSETSPFKNVLNKTELENDLKLNSNTEVPLLTLLLRGQLSNKSQMASYDTSQRIVDWNNENNLLQASSKKPSNNTFLVTDTTSANAELDDPFFDDPVAESDKEPLMFRITGKISGELKPQSTSGDSTRNAGGVSNNLEKETPRDSFVTVRSHLSDHSSDDDVLSGLLQKKRKDKTNGYRNQETVQATGSSLASLKDLPSLNVGSAKGSRSEWLEHFDNILHAATFNSVHVAQDDYEDDFQSSESTHSGKSGSKSLDKKKSDSHSKDNTEGSVEEDIEEDISIPADDMLNASASLGDDFTSDRTISHLSGSSGYDYMEKLS